MSGRFLPFWSTWSFVPEFDCIFCVTTGCGNAIMPIFTNIVAPFDFEVETCIVYFTDIFSRKSQAGCRWNGSVSTPQDVGTFVVEIVGFQI